MRVILGDEVEVKSKQFLDGCIVGETSAKFGTSTPLPRYSPIWIPPETPWPVGNGTGPLLNQPLTARPQDTFASVDSVYSTVLLTVAYCAGKITGGMFVTPR